MSEASPINVEFEGEVLKSPKPGGWTYLIWPGSAAFFGTRGLVKVGGTMDGDLFESAFMPLGDGTHKLPVTARMLKKLRKAPGDRITVVLDRRLKAMPK